MYKHMIVLWHKIITYKVRRVTQNISKTIPKLIITINSKHKGYQEMVFLVSQAQVTGRLAVSEAFLSSQV